jgi:hypothetical protein
MQRRLIAALVVSAGFLVAASPAAAFRDRDCSEFPTQKAAQKYFHKDGGPRHDLSHLDADHDGIIGEDNP